MDNCHWVAVDHTTFMQKTCMYITCTCIYTRFSFLWISSENSSVIALPLSGWSTPCCNSNIYMWMRYIHVHPCTVWTMCLYSLYGDTMHVYGFPYQVTLFNDEFQSLDLRPELTDKSHIWILQTYIHTCIHEPILRNCWMKCTCIIQCMCMYNYLIDYWLVDNILSSAGIAQGAQSLPIVTLSRWHSCWKGQSYSHNAGHVY